MSTNYYATWPEYNLRLHIGKTGAGHVTLQALDHVYRPEHDDMGRLRTLPDDWLEIHSWRKWMQTFNDRPGFEITNEYGVVEPLAWLDSYIHTYSSEHRRSQWQWIQDRRNQFSYLLDDYWVDDENFSFCRRDFF